MAYSDFKTISQVKTSFDLSISSIDLFSNIDRVEPSEYLKMTLKRNLQVAFDNESTNAGLAQCIAEMVAAQRFNQARDKVIENILRFFWRL